MKFFSYFKDFLAPKKCCNCSSLGAFLCHSCTKTAQKNTPFCYVCKMPSLDFEVHRKCKNGFFLDGLIVPYHYREKCIKKSITVGKFYKKKEIFEEMANYISPYIWEYLEKYPQEKLIITAIPLHMFRRWKRWYNQSEILAKILWENLSLTYISSLKRIRHTWHQSRLSRPQRLKNTKNCFNIKKDIIDKVDRKIIILVDDVVSSGTTLNEAAKVLKEYGAKKVIWVVIASD